MEGTRELAVARGAHQAHGHAQLRGGSGKGGTRASPELLQDVLARLAPQPQPPASDVLKIRRTQGLRAKALHPRPRLCGHERMSLGPRPPRCPGSPGSPEPRGPQKSEQQQASL